MYYFFLFVGFDEISSKVDKNYRSNSEFANCDSKEDCLGDLLCGSNNGFLPFDVDADLCYDPTGLQIFFQTLIRATSGTFARAGW